MSQRPSEASRHLIATRKGGTTMRLSILDQAPVAAGHTSAEALARSVDLARAGDALGTASG